MARQCALIEAIGNEAECREEACAFWERGGAVVPGGCAIQRLGLDLKNESLAHYLLDLRRAIEGAQDESIAAAAREELADLVPADLVEEEPRVY
jgi:hypothetical protein